MPKNTPDSSNISTPDRRTNGPSAACRKRLLPWRNPRFACIACEIILPASPTGNVALCCAHAESELVSVLAIPAVDGTDPDAFWAARLPEGDSALAASTAATTVLAACRAPKPSARPNRTASISSSVVARVRSRKSYRGRATHRLHPSSVTRLAQPGINGGGNEAGDLDYWWTLCRRSRASGVEPEQAGRRAGACAQAGRCLGRPPYKGVKAPRMCPAYPALE
jgi:hypothetical protein